MRAVAIAMGLVLALTTGGTALAADGEMSRGLNHLRLAGDLDGDGRVDTIGVERNPAVQDTPVAAIGGGEPVVTARRGKDGTQLWRAQVTGTTILPARVGPGGRPGVLVVSGPTVDRMPTAGGVTASSTGGAGAALVDAGPVIITALDGPSGATLWTRTFDTGAYAGLAALTPTGHGGQALVAEAYTAFVGPLPGASSDQFLITIVTRRDTPAGITSTNRAVVVNGTDGATATDVSLATTDTRPVVRAAGDLNADGQDDFVFIRTAGGNGINAVDAVTGSQLWSNTDIPIPSFPALTAVDLNSDARDELILTGVDETDEPVSSARVLDGASGRMELFSPADSLVPVGDVNHDGRTELVVSTAGPESVAYQLIELDGTVLIARSHAVAFPEGSTDQRVVPAGTVGEVDDDGFPDLAHTVGYWDGTSSQSSRTLVSGRSLNVIRSPVSGLPLGGPVAATTGDFLDLGVTGDTVALTLTDGVTGLPVWTHSAPSFLADAVRGDLDVGIADVTGDGIVDVIANVLLSAPTCTTVEHEETGCVFGQSSTSAVRTFVLSGATGTLHYQV